SKRWTKAQLLIPGPGTVKRVPTTWNAWVRHKLLEANKDRPVGQRLQLARFLRDNSASLCVAYKGLTDHQRASFNGEMAADRVERLKMIRANPRAVQRKVISTFGSMQKQVSSLPIFNSKWAILTRVQWSTICEQFGLEGFYFAVRGSVDDRHDPELFCSAKALAFFRHVLGITPENLILKLEAYCVNLVATPNKDPRATLVSRARKLIQEGLDNILQSSGLAKKRVTMNYENYEARIVEAYGVRLVG
ncbi:hypothetical protein BDN72DRAFT_744779, partial [Pluteus cervinus]